jgi:hypothetical protein
MIGGLLFVLTVQLTVGGKVADPVRLAALAVAARYPMNSIHHQGQPDQRHPGPAADV